MCYRVFTKKLSEVGDLCQYMEGPINKCKVAKPIKICSRIVRGNDGQLENIDEIHGRSLIKTAIKIVKGGTASSQH